MFDPDPDKAHANPWRRPTTTGLGAFPELVRLRQSIAATSFRLADRDRACPAGGSSVKIIHTAQARTTPTTARGRGPFDGNVRSRLARLPIVPTGFAPDALHPNRIYIVGLDGKREAELKGTSGGVPTRAAIPKEGESSRILGKGWRKVRIRIAVIMATHAVFAP